MLDDLVDLVEVHPSRRLGFAKDYQGLGGAWAPYGYGDSTQSRRRRGGIALPSDPITTATAEMCARATMDMGDATAWRLSPSW